MSLISYKAIELMEFNNLEMLTYHDKYIYICLFANWGLRNLQAHLYQFSSVSNSNLQTWMVWKLILEKIEYPADVCHNLK